MVGSAACLFILITLCYVVYKDVDIRVVYEMHIKLITLSNNKLHGEDIVGPKHLKQWLATSQAKLTTDIFGNSSRSELTHSASCVTLLKSPFII